MWAESRKSLSPGTSRLGTMQSHTEDAVEFAIDQQMDEVTEAALSAWIGQRKVRERFRVGVVNAGNVPLVGLQDLLAVLICGHSYVGVLSSKSPYLLPAFVKILLDQGADIDAKFVDRDEMWGEVDAVIATGSNEAIAQFKVLASRQGMTPEKCLFRGNRCGAAILNGFESESDLDGLALDVLLHEGMGCRNVALIMVPAGLDPDNCLKHFAETRGEFPAHLTFVDACGRLQVSTCARALSKLADRGRIALPAPTNNYAAGAGPRLLADPVPAPERLPEVVKEVQGLTLVKVTDTDQREIWNTLLHHEHPRGVTTFCGALVRYLIDSAHGYLGAVGFSAAALRLAAREQWMA